MQKNTYGKRSEIIASDYLKKKGYKILEVNYKNNVGEIDIIAKDKDYIVFVEVKSRTNNPYYFKTYGLPKRAVNRTKQRFIISAANHYIRTHNIKNKLYSLDVIEVYFKPSNGKLPEIDRINHIRGAYYA